MGVNSGLQWDKQERPAARRGGRYIGASELEALGVGGGEGAQGTPKGGLLVPAGSGSPVVPQKTYCSSS
jgi:hypothetical protein